MIEIDLLKLERGTHEGQVKVRRGGKIFYRKQRLGQKETGEPKKPEVQYEKVTGLVGELPTYDSTPDTIRLPPNIVDNMGEAVEESKKYGVEVVRVIDKDEGEISMDEIVRGNEHSCSIPHIGFGSYHTHPGGCINSFSDDDMLCFMVRKHKIMIAHDIRDGGIWVAIKTAEAEELMATTTPTDIDNELKERRYIARNRRSGNSGNDYRSGIKDFCDGVNVKLYYGMPDGDIREYNEHEQEFTV